ncbi:outer membrane beta-barrel domain-containing protein [Bradymonas sediminis]|uniref:Uncharacterized protein n=1 Tax=Bradymonas sediminis TaxID=1548548 RepID=A0A2Z4FM01_9DELT|nr:outer membrane beta-barrel domain-containing protein [Bradymonas sediminis]AWV90009.1 hypothetical protein DN745_11930 [Bradymonas sediminis]TDP76036.1 outer membrane beta-barrel protein [Bradymonas sediminis]
MFKLKMLTLSSSRASLAWLVAILMLALATPAFANDTDKEDFEDTIHVVQRKPVLQKGRFDLTPRFGMSVNDSMYRHFKVGANANYHFTESFYVGALFDWYNFGETLGGPTGAFKASQNATGSISDAAVVNWSGGLELGYVPLVGKFAFAESFIIYYDFAISAGAEYIDSQSIALPASSGGPGGTVALTTRVFFNDWLALNLEVRDLIFSADLKGQQGALTNIVTVAAGLSFYLPTAFEYSQPEED